MCRVSAPLKDQQHVDRLGLLYFSRSAHQSFSRGVSALKGVACRPHNDVVLKTITESPVLQREGYLQNDFEKTGNPVPTMERPYPTLPCL